MNNVRIALFRGKSWTSKLIKWFTWSKYSHVAIIFSDGMLYEAWDKRGVIKNLTADLAKDHQKGTQVDVYKFIEPVFEEEEYRMRNFAESKLGLKYDKKAILGILLRKKLQNENAYFCSEYVMDICKATGRKLVNAESYKIPPGCIAESVALVFEESFLVK